MTLILNIYIQGIKNIWRSKFLIGMMFLFKVVVSLILLFPLYLMLSTSFANSAKASNFLRWFDFSLIIDFVYYWGKILPIYFFMFILICFVTILTFIFLSGGFWGSLRDRVSKRGVNSRMESFFGYCGKYFGGMFKIAIVMIVLYMIAFIIFLLLVIVFDSIAGRGSILEITSWRMIVKFLMGIILFFLMNMVGDYLRIFLIENFGERFSAILRKTFKFVLTNFFRALSLYCILSLVLVFVICVYLGLYKILNGMPQTGFFIFLTFLIQQIFVAFQSFYRLVYYSSEVIFYDKITSNQIIIP